MKTYPSHQFSPMARSSDFVSYLPWRQLGLLAVRVYWPPRRGSRARKFAAIRSFVITVVALSSIAARLASSTGKLLIAFDLETMTAETAKAVALTLANNPLTLLIAGSVFRRILNWRGVRGDNLVRFRALNSCRW